MLTAKELIRYVRENWDTPQLVLEADLQAMLPSDSDQEAELTEAYEEGYKAGHLEGHAEGVQEGYDDGYETALAEQDGAA